MKYSVLFLDLAKQDLVEIKNYLELEASPEISKAFIEQLDEQLEMTENFPNINAVYPGNPRYRRLVMQNYPYCAYYKIDEEHKTINIYRVLHTSRNIELLIPRSLP